MIKAIGTNKLKNPTVPSPEFETIRDCPSPSGLKVCSPGCSKAKPGFAAAPAKWKPEAANFEWALFDTDGLREHKFLENLDQGF